MHRVTPHVLALIMLIAGISHAQSLADAARANRKQKAREGATATKVISDDDLAASPDASFTWSPGPLPPEAGRCLHRECGNTVIPLPTWMQHGFPTVGFSTSRSH